MPGKFGLSVNSLLVTVPNLVTVTGTGIKVNYDPNYDASKNEGKPQTIVIVDTASISFPSIGVTGVAKERQSPEYLAKFDALAFYTTGDLTKD